MTGSSETAASAEVHDGEAPALTPPKHARKYVKPKVLPIPLPAMCPPHPRLIPQPHTALHSAQRTRVRIGVGPDCRQPRVARAAPYFARPPNSRFLPFPAGALHPPL